MTRMARKYKQKSSGSIRRVSPTSNRWKAYYRRKINGKMETFRPGYTFLTPQEADRWLLSEEALWDSGNWTSPAQRRAEAKRKQKRDSTTFEQYAFKWIATRENPSTQRPLVAGTVNEYRSYTTGILAPLATQPVSQITEAQLKDWWHDNQHRPVLRNHAYQFMKSVFKSIVKDKLVEETPCTLEHARRPPKQRSRDLEGSLIESVTPADIAAMADAIGNQQWRMFILLAAYTGFRPGEILALKRNDITKAVAPSGAPRWTLRVDEDIKKAGKDAAGNHKPVTIGPPKTEGSYRTIPLAPHLVEPLEKHIKTYAQPGENGLLFPSTSKKSPLPYVQQVWGKTAKSNHGKPTGFHAVRIATGVPEFTLYDFRRWANKAWLDAGMDSRDAEFSLGHSHTRTVEAYNFLFLKRVWEFFDAVSEEAGWHNPAKDIPKIDQRQFDRMTPEKRLEALQAMTGDQLAANAETLKQMAIAATRAQVNEQPDEQSRKAN